jgi:hypothetical protein
VIPVILRPCDWHPAPFGNLLASPADGRPVTKWADPDDAFLDIAKAIRAAAGVKDDVMGSTKRPKAAALAKPADAGPRSSNLRMRRTFTDRDRDRFLDDAFEFMARFFENSLNELEARNTGIEVTFKRIAARRFTASIYRGGANLARCQVRLGGFGGDGIAFSYNAHPDDNSLNESLSVQTGEQSLFPRALGMQSHRLRDGDPHLGFEGAAEYYWGLFIEPLQR